MMACVTRWPAPETPHPKPRRPRRAEVAYPPVEDRDVHEHEQELSAGRQPEPEHAPPGDKPRRPLRAIHRDVFLQPAEIDQQQRAPRPNRDRARATGAGAPEPPAR